MKFTIEERNSDAKVKLDLVKHPRNKSISILMEDSREKLLELSAQKGKITIAVDEEKATVAGLTAAGTVDESQGATGASGDALRNWKILDDSIQVFHPVTGSVVELERKSGGTNVPEEQINDILGQPEMTFAVAFALSMGKHSMLIGPTGTGKTSMYRWFAKNLGWNLIIAPIARGTEAAHLIGDYLPVGQALFEWMDGPVTEAGRLSFQHPTILLLDEINRIGNIAEFSRVYPVLDDTKMLELKERRLETGAVERIDTSKLFVGATANPSDDERADYVGVQDLDPALSSRFSYHPTVDYPSVDIEKEALMIRVPSLDAAAARKMCATAKKIRESADVRFPISFRELVDWGTSIEAFGYSAAAQVAVINKAPRVFHQAIDNLIKAMG